MVYELEAEEVEVEPVFVGLREEPPTEEQLLDFEVCDGRPLHRERRDDRPDLEQVRVVDDFAELHQDVCDLLVDARLEVVTCICTGHELVV